LLEFRPQRGAGVRAVVQRIERAAVSVSDRRISSVGKGICVFLGIEKDDSPGDADYLLEKIINLRIFEDRDGKMNLSLLDEGGEMMVVSQFTLLADCRKGRRPSFTRAEDPERAKALYELFVAKGRERGVRTEVGEFQAMMKIDLVNDGPLTMLLDSKKAL
jgi:D-aminoacyl-tRNA deacylase